MLTISAPILIAGMQATARESIAPLSPWARWLGSWGRLSYEIYLTHMFVVLGIVRLFEDLEHDMKSGAWWYLPALAFCWLLGFAVSRVLSEPCDSAMRRRWLAQGRNPLPPSDSASRERNMLEPD